MDVYGSTPCVHIAMIYVNGACLLQANTYTHWRLEPVCAAHSRKGSLSVIDPTLQSGKQRNTHHTDILCVSCGNTGL